MKFSPLGKQIWYHACVKAGQIGEQEPMQLLKKAVWQTDKTIAKRLQDDAWNLVEARNLRNELGEEVAAEIVKYITEDAR